MTGKKGREQENAYAAAAAQAQAKADTAVAKAAEPDELEIRRRARVLALDKWSLGEGPDGTKVPIDVRNMPGNDVNMGLFNDALNVHDRGRIGRGMGTMGDSVNPNYAMALDKENEAERKMMASGALEGNVDDALAQKDAEMTGLYQTADQRNMNIAGLQSNAYQNAAQRDIQFKLRPKRSVYRDLAMKWLSPPNVNVNAGG